MSTEAPKLSPLEKIKEDSQFLRGSIGEELANDSDHFDKSDIQLLKFHGTYQQDDRDKRAELKKQGGGKAYSMMVRCRIPGGRITSKQMLAQLDLCDELGTSTIKITTRQTLQLHGILKKDLRETINRINEMELSTLAACGDVNRNIMCCPAKRVGGVHDEMAELTDALTHALAPQTPAYHELWVTDPETGEKTLEGGGPVSEPLYGPRYLPRKFKTGIALPEDNCIDIYTQDLGFLAVVRDGKIIGYNVLVGGGMGTTPALKRTYPALAKRMAFCTPDQAIDVAKAVIKVQRDYGNREDRKVARMKYLVDQWGIEKFRRAVEEYFGEPLKDCTEDEVTGVDDHMGWQEQGDGKLSYGLSVENGRLYDNDQIRLKAMMREICTTFGTEMRMTGYQSIIFTDIDPADKDKLIEIIKRHGAPTTEETSTVRRWSMACVALPTCGLAITESERRLPSLIDDLEQPLAKLGLEKERFTIRMTGCPNGCARPYNADIALVGKAKDKYTMFLGGGWLGNRLAYIYKDLVPSDQVVDEIVAVAKIFKTNRNEGESLGDFCDRIGKDDLLGMTEASE
ncbi:NADPH-dependent assimilatory sulfite reductase hemoprotein subunit [Roseiconus lacunae]|uniref:NADPH-dependent assimilatory sulfite reductase hemoprotein subunit n=1 Tax=Roseiconus lacunae TaxID=2605694 RepID=A0ABT7PKC3_9BACT|nr:NADPH-dependent assimilatory sulfite reductase hemoprotein subunit [Roseiconus lacunae]MCD0459477.1 NADPH-dependent assimilatory sulfite reductase hemoprotein subunit [Roseiconus lacunae]MDM4016736.1 NADPH-dependent assimilatory sulfite reductase hemoprotein subunit [Roseiconus lacunae]WRQ50950.1 NADPH-dependent assimilatory sulfite reductase hemoprotein subunit [Stieleria sp. HD01]